MEKVGCSILIVLFKPTKQRVRTAVIKSGRKKKHIPTFLGKYKYCISVQYIRLDVAKL